VEKIPGAIVILVIFSSCLTNPMNSMPTAPAMMKQDQESGKKAAIIIPGSDFITIDEVAFDAEDLMRVADGSDNLMAYFDRTENKAMPAVPGIKVFNGKKRHIYTLMPVIEKSEIAIHIKNIENDTRGKISLTASINGMNVDYTCDVDFFRKNYSIDYVVNVGFGGSSQEITVDFNSSPVLYQKVSVSIQKGVGQTKLQADNNYLADNCIDAAVFALSLKLIDEINREYSAKNSHSGQRFNHNGTRDMNHNPIDSF
jgi:hypothetical protein